MWPDRRLLDLFGIELPIVLAPMAGAMDFELAAAVAEAGGLGSLPCGMLSPQAIREQVERFRGRTEKPINLNFFSHTPATPNNALEARWHDRLAPYYRELGVDPAASAPQANRAPFDDAALDVVLELRPKVVELPVRAARGAVFASRVQPAFWYFGCATTVAEARWLEARGVSAIVAQGFEAGGHRGDISLRRCDDAGRNICAVAADRGRGRSAGDCGRRHR